MTSSVNFSKKSIVFVTGASKGIGRAIAVELSRRIGQHSIFVLLARSQKGLEETKSQIQEIDKCITVLTYIVDLSKPDINEYNKLFQDVLKTTDLDALEFGIIFHNAAHAGELKQTTDLTDLEIWRQHYDLHMFSMALLNSVFIKQLRSAAPQLAIVNITSLCGRSPFVNLAMYGSAKAARDLFFKVLAVEEPNIIILNYAPGPVDTDMFTSVIDTAQSDELRKSFKEMKETVILSPAQSANRLLDILEKGDFKTGDTLD